LKQVVTSSTVFLHMDSSHIEHHIYEFMTECGLINYDKQKLQFPETIADW
jgi:hypothetical protein